MTLLWAVWALWTLAWILVALVSLLPRARRLLAAGGLPVLAAARTLQQLAWTLPAAAWVVDPLRAGRVSGVAPLWWWVLPVVVALACWRRLQRQQIGASPRTLDTRPWWPAQPVWSGSAGARVQHWWCVGVRRSPSGLLLAVVPAELSALGASVSPMWVLAEGMRVAQRPLPRTLPLLLAPRLPGLGRLGQLALRPVGGGSGTPLDPVRAEVLLSAAFGPLTFGEPGVCYFPLIAPLRALDLAQRASGAPQSATGTSRGARAASGVAAAPGTQPRAERL